MSTLHVRQGLGGTRHLDASLQVYGISQCFPKRGRLVQFNGFDQPTRELSEYDALRLGTEMQDEEREEVPDPVQSTTCAWSAEEIGRLILCRRKKMTISQIADETGRTVAGVAMELHQIRKDVQTHKGRKGC